MAEPFEEERAGETPAGEDLDAASHITEPSGGNGDVRRSRISRILARYRAKGKETSTRAPWELWIAVAIGVATITGAALTYVSIRVDSAAVDADRQAVVETVQVQSSRVVAIARSRSEGSQIAQYRVLNAQADAVESTDPAQARLLRRQADGLLAAEWIDIRYRTGIGATATWNHELRQDAIIRVNEYMSVPQGQPELTVRKADDLHDRSGELALCVVASILVIVGLTVARLVPPERWRPAVFAAALVGYLALLVVAVPLALTSV
ncbi:hypothetical protein OG884_12250 [Streptosporangium sp. NBC_01755]|uniref:hypothetical protein n=1 Tax=Streptosporangium sp. NBC_01755 TaxID=2975949 RepID=UPI002DDC8CE0|nr:hypothetical protein [Streptosporangium sp. NBC_01755]WSD02634.1 hypothetical protein OG884_12250 [Streptosporangium sp. NBC_01755]